MTAPKPMPVISRGVPAYTNDDDSGVYPASRANDSDYSTQWRTQDLSGTTPPNTAYLAYDLSGVSSGQRGNVVLIWYNNFNGDYDYTFNGTSTFNNPDSYTIDANAAVGGSLPAAGWVNLVTVTGNHYHSRQHALNLTGYNWVRINCTVVNGSTFNLGCSLQMDVHDVHVANQDNFIIYGDSITAGGLDVDNQFGIGSLAQLINAKVPGNFPICEGGGIGGRTSADGAANIATWLALFTGKYVGLAYGTNDANGSVPTATFKTNMQTMITAVVNASKIPILPHIPWGNTAAIQTNGPAMNTAIDQLKASNSTAIAGPDLWGFFQQNPGDISNDNVHPNTAGYTALRQQWANALLTNVYGVTAFSGRNGNYRSFLRVGP